MPNWRVVIAAAGAGSFLFTAGVACDSATTYTHTGCGTSTRAGQGACGPRKANGRGLRTTNLVATGGSHLDTAFLGRVNAACGKALIAQVGRPFPLPTLDLQNPKPADLPSIGRYFATVDQMPEIADALNALGEPDSQKAEWDQLRKLVNEAADYTTQEIRDATASNLTAFEQSLDIINRLDRTINLLGSQVGISPLSPCARELG